MSPRRRIPRAPLYDPSFEHDACGVGFVADAGGGSRSDVLPLALAGLAALRHRGAVAADGASSDGAGVALPLERALVDLLAAGLGRGPGVVSLFLPRRGTAAGRRLVAQELEAAGVPVTRWRAVPFDDRALGAEAAGSRPVFAQALVRRPRGLPDRTFELRLVVARRRIEAAAAARRIDLSVPSASCRTVVYKGLVGGDRLAELYPDLTAPLALSHATFHQRYATNTQPVWRLAQPFRRIAHNGEINTVRGNRQQVRGRSADRAGLAAARMLAAAGPLLSSNGSDSLSLDEMIELLEATGWPIEAALLAAIPEATTLRPGHRDVAAFQRQIAGDIAPWDGPAAIVFGDGRRVGALVDRNGLRPLAFAVTSDGLVAAASEAGAIPLPAGRTIRRGRLGPGEMLLVDPARRLVLEDDAAKAEAVGRLGFPEAARPRFHDALPEGIGETSPSTRFVAGLHAENARLDIKTMALEAHEPLWSMGDDTPTPGLGRGDRPAADHLRQSFAQVTNPPIDPERERAVMDLHVELGPRPALLGGPPRRLRTVRLERPVIADLDRLLDLVGRDRALVLDATWPAAEGPASLAVALDRLAADAIRAARSDVGVVVVSDAGLSTERLPVPSVLAVGAVHTALSGAGLRGRSDIVADAADVLDVHGLAMALAAGATVVRPRLAVELAAELAGSRGAEALTAAETVHNLLDAFEAGLRKTLARMGISTAASYCGGQLFETIELTPGLVGRCFPDAPSWPGSVGEREIARRLLARAAVASDLPVDRHGPRLPDPGFARFRADGERHLFSPAIAGEIQALAAHADGPEGLESALGRYREALGRPAAVVRDQLVVRPRAAVAPLAEVEPAVAIARRFVVSAMSVGALSPEAHQALTIGIQRAGGAANTGEGGEDPAWYEPGPDGRRRDARIKQVASGRFGVTATYLARADQLEIKIAQGSKPGEGGQLPAKKATAYIAALRRGAPAQSYISPPPHHDIYSIEDLAQLITDLRALNPSARIGVKLVATRGVGTIAAGVVKAGADYIHLSGHAGGTGASPLSSIKHVGVPWELGLSEVHQVLLRQGLRDRVALRSDGGLQTGRDLLVMALLGAEEFAFGTSALVALGCDMARQCHLDTCPTGIATQRDDLRAKFTGTPELVERWALALAEDLRRELAAVGARSVGEVVGETAVLHARPGRRTLALAPILAAPRWEADAARRAAPELASASLARAAASPLERGLAEALAGQGPIVAGGIVLETSDRTFGAALSGALERGEIRGPVRLDLNGSAGQSFGAFATTGADLRLTGQANDYVGKGLSGGTVVVRPEPELAARAADQAIVGNTCLYGATGGRLHVVGRAGMRFAVRNSGAEAVVEGVGAHGCEYMTAGVVVVLGPTGPNFGAGMTGGRAWLIAPADGPVVDGRSVRAVRVGEVLADRADGRVLVDELRRLVEAHAAAGSTLAAELLSGGRLEAEAWLVEPIAAAGVAAGVAGAAGVAVGPAGAGASVDEAAVSMAGGR